MRDSRQFNGQTSAIASEAAPTERAAGESGRLTLATVREEFGPPTLGFEA